MLTEKGMLERAFRALDELVVRQVNVEPEPSQNQSYTSRKCTPEAALSAIPPAADPSEGEQAPAPAVLGRGDAKRGGADRVEVALRWFCSTCGMDGVIWHLPELTCDAKERAIIRAHGERTLGCRRFNYRAVSDSETRPRREA